MLLVGIPKPAVKHKLTLSGMDDRFIDFPADSDIELLPDDLKNKLATSFINRLEAHMLLCESMERGFSK